MTDAGIEHDFDDKQQIADALGMIDYEHYLLFKDSCCRGLLILSDSLFLQALGEFLYLADDRNSVKIIRIWANECAQYDILFRMHEAKIRAENTNPDFQE